MATGARIALTVLALLLLAALIVAVFLLIQRGRLAQGDRSAASSVQDAEIRREPCAGPRPDAEAEDSVHREAGQRLDEEADDRVGAQAEFTADRVDAESQTREQQQELLAAGGTPYEGPVSGLRVGVGAEAGQGGIEVRVEQPATRIAVMGPDRYFHAGAGLSRASLEGLAPGTYFALGTLKGHDAAIHEIEVTAGKTVSVALDLRRAGGN